MLPPPAHRAGGLSPEALHGQLRALNLTRLEPSLGGGDWERALGEEVALRRLERDFVEAERARIAPLARDVPRDPEAFVAWFEALRDSGPGQNDPLFVWLAEEATLPELRWFLKQEVAGEAGFDDLVALTQLRFPVQAKLEMARNYWDEMGQGHASGMHGPMLERLARALSVAEAPGEIVWEAQALANLLVALAASRAYAYHSVGALGAIELTAPDRASLVNLGLKRLGVAPSERQYFALHATLDKKHAAAWNQEVLRSLVAARPEAAPALAEGALMRLAAGARCFARYRRELGRTATARLTTPAA